MFNNTKIKLFIGSWNIFILRIIKKKGHDEKRLGTTGIEGYIYIGRGEEGCEIQDREGEGFIEVYKKGN